MKTALIVLFLLSLAGNWFLFKEREDLLIENDRLSAEVMALQKEIEVAEETQEEYDKLEEELKEQQRQLNERVNKLSNVLARTDFRGRVENDAEGLEESINRANEKWQEEYNDIGEDE